MYFSTAAIAATLAFAQTGLAAPATEKVSRNDPHELDFRTFGASGCSAENQGVYTLELSSSGVCSQFVDPIGSLLVGDNLCTLTIYSDAECSENPVVAPTGVCQNGQWLSYKMTC
ncbi:hypothetical protein SEUCBS140593_008321 [Sporothrix eucalyptigena]|uniref:Uncharacterized protein n=1 Tax=Sporothrix eucalyptigena TaxID=1812306 RepID=A0ABP0CKK1_9PEZI